MNAKQRAAVRNLPGRILPQAKPAPGAPSAPVRWLACGVVYLIHPDGTFRRETAEPETPLDPERLAAQAGWLRQGIRMAIADLGRLARRMDVHVSGYSDRLEVDRITAELRRTLEGEQEAGS